MATTTYAYTTPAGDLSIVRFKGGPWRLWAGGQFLGSFATAEEAAAAIGNGAVKWPANVDPKRWTAPADVALWRFGMRM